MILGCFGDPPFSETPICGIRACAQGNTAGSPSSWWDGGDLRLWWPGACCCTSARHFITFRHDFIRLLARSVPTRFSCGTNKRPLAKLRELGICVYPSDNRYCLFGEKEKERMREIERGREREKERAREEEKERKREREKERKGERERERER